MSVQQEAKVKNIAFKQTVSFGSAVFYTVILDAWVNTQVAEQMVWVREGFKKE